MYSPLESDCAYLAGLIDGEGHISCIGVRRERSSQRRLTITNTHLPTLVWVAERFGGRIYSPGKHYGPRTKISFQWYCYGADVDRVLAAAVTYMRIKQMEARIALSIGSCRKRNPSDLRRMTDETVQVEHALRQRVLNERAKRWVKADIPPHLSECKPRRIECRNGHGPEHYTQGRGCRLCKRDYWQRSEQRKKSRST